MNVLQSVILGLIQGITEFLPVSSSGHLVLMNSLLGLHSGNIMFEVALHFATLLAVVFFFFNRIIRILLSPVNYVLMGSRSEADIQGSKYLLLIIIGTIPAGIVGLLLKDHIEQAFSSTLFVGYMLLVTTAILFLTLLARPHRANLRYIDAILIGIAQAVAILPGISRSGSTISAGMFTGVKKETAFDFSFLLSLPAVLGAFILELKDALAITGQHDRMIIFIPGMAAAFISGYISLLILRRIVIAGKFAYFGIYTLIVGILAIVFSHG